MQTCVHLFHPAPNLNTDPFEVTLWVEDRRYTAFILFSDKFVEGFCLNFIYLKN
jgi:hypothetical protein